MSITTETVAALAPDQASLKAASKLMKSAKWPVLLFDDPSHLVWGECQGSGANPYRVVFDVSDQGYKCTCPSRKFPCKHALALMWLYAETPQEFGAGDVPEWVTDWLGRRRKSGGAAAKTTATSGEGKSLSLARAAEPEKADDPKTIARREAAQKKRAEDTEAAIHTAMDELEIWIEDQLRTGLGPLLKDLNTRCRAIAARMVDGKAGALAGRIDEIPGRVLALPGEERLDALVGQLSKLVILARAFRADPNAPDLRRAIATSETREAVLNNPDALRVKSRWEVAGERITTGRNDMISQATWLLNLEAGPRFALLLDYFPVSVGRRTGAFASGDQFEAELVFYPGRAPLRALIDERQTCTRLDWPTADPIPLADAARFETNMPWGEVAPVLLPAGRVALTTKGRAWWRASDGGLTLPMDQAPPDALTGMTLDQATALWDGARLSVLSAQTKWGRVALDG